MKYCSLTLAIIYMSTQIAYAQSSHNTQVYIQLGHVASVKSIALSPDGKYALSGSSDESVKLWEVASGREIRTFNGHGSTISSVAFSPDGTQALTASWDKTVKLWDIASGRELRTYTGHTGAVTSVAFSPDGKQALTGSWDKTAIIWEVNTGRVIHTLTGHTGWVNSVVFSPDSRYAISGSSDDTIKLWELSSGREVRTFTGHSRNIRSVDFSPDGRFIISGGEDNIMKLWEVSSGEEVRTYTGHSKFITSVAFSPDGTHALSSSLDNTIKLWNISNGQEERTFKGHTDFVETVMFTSDGSYILSGSKDQTLKLWEVKSGIEVTTFTGYSNDLRSSTFTPDGVYTITGSKDHTLKLWDVVTGRKEQTFTGHSEEVHSVSVSPNGQYVISGSSDNTIKLWEVASGKVVTTFAGHSDDVQSVVFSTDGQHVLSGSNDGTVKMWDISSGQELRTFTGYPKKIFSVDFSPDARYVLAGGDVYPGGERTLRLWEVSTGNEVRPFNPVGDPGDIHKDGKSYSVAYSPDGQYVLSSRYSRIKLWDVSEGQQMRTFNGHTEDVTTVAFSSDGEFVVSGSLDGNVKLWETSSGKELHTFTGHLNAVWSVAFSQDGEQILSASGDGTTRIWDIENGQEVASFIDLPNKEYATALPDNYYTASRNASDYVHFVNGMNLYTFENFDLIYNRPDIVAKRLGKASPELINAYYKAYLKRLDKMGFTVDQISTDMHLPEVAFLRDDFPIQTTDKKLTFDVEATDSKYKLDRLNVYVNDVPINGTQGINLKERDIQQATIPVELILSDGVNKIQISAHNQSGAESLKQTVELTYSGSKSTPELYVVAIGVSDYQNDDYDLRYAAKDANDLATLYNQSGAFEKVHQITITDSEATRENILGLKAKLNQTKVDDQVVLFVAGHGLLDDDFDYYFATHDIDFENPAGKGITYTELEGLLDGIPARNKLLLMDTCNSGEVDKSSVEATEEMQLASNVSVRAVGTRGIKRKKVEDADDSGLGLKNSFELMKELFADLRRGSGAMVISSASGVEFALESDRWKNGVFTYAVLNGLKNETADQNDDGTITVSELRDYVSEEVQQLTNGQQTPTSRRENLENDFRVW